MNYQQILNEIVEETQYLTGKGKVADYIPELAKVSPNQFGIFLQMMDGSSYHVGAAHTQFAIQSISKVFSLSLAVSLLGEKVWERVDVEPSGTAFNSLLQLEYEKGIPRNPFINAGALVVIDMLISELKKPKEDLMDYIRMLAGKNEVHINKKVAHSEKQHGFRNAAVANLLKDFGNIHNKVEDVLDLYFDMCSIEMNCAELSQTFKMFANHGVLPGTEKQILTRSQTKRQNALMQSCGFYDESGEFTFTVGLPGKSGVGGGIVALFPEQFTITVWSPLLNEKGNSIKGMKALELFTTKSELSLF
ncbi:MAG: glutaminase [Bacteroidales bacterium]|nr:glutaminase [Bacteroidales bacterium]